MLILRLKRADVACVIFVVEYYETVYGCKIKHTSHSISSNLSPPMWSEKHILLLPLQGHYLCVEVIRTGTHKLWHFNFVPNKFEGCSNAHERERRRRHLLKQLDILCGRVKKIFITTTTSIHVAAAQLVVIMTKRWIIHCAQWWGGAYLALQWCDISQLLPGSDQHLPKIVFLFRNWEGDQVVLLHSLL